MTELSFLISLLLDHKLPKATQTAIKDRIREIEIAQPAIRTPMVQYPTQQTHMRMTDVLGAPIVHGAQQSASTAALLAKHGLNVPAAPGSLGTIVDAHTGEVLVKVPPDPQPVDLSRAAGGIPIIPAVSAQTPQAIQALNDRANLMANAGKAPKHRKF